MYVLEKEKAGPSGATSAEHNERNLRRQRTNPNVQHIIAERMMLKPRLFYSVERMRAPR